MNWLYDISNNPFYEFTIILVLAALLGSVSRLLKQPLIVMFIALGIIVGPSVLDVTKSHEQIHLLAEISITVLLFIVGLKLDLRIIKSVGKIALLKGLVQVLFTAIFGYGIGHLIGFTWLHSFYIAVTLTFSNTIIIAKLLSDKKEIDSLHGQIAVGFLIVQDIVVILVMIVLSTIQQGGETPVSENVLRTLMAGLGLLGFIFIAIQWIIPGLSSYLAKSQELFTLFAIAGVLLLAAIGQIIGFSGEVGAFLAGISLASSDFREVISSRLVSLRDFLLLFFFVHLGGNLDLSIIGGQIDTVLIFSVFVLIGNPLIVLIIMGLLGYRKRTSFLAGLTVAQISEFSLIFAGLGLSVGHITNEIVDLITLVGLISIGLSAYMIHYSHQIFVVLSLALNVFQRSKNYTEIEDFQKEQKTCDVIIIRLGRFGRRLSEIQDTLLEISYLGVYFDLSVVHKWKAKGKAILYGDIEDPDLLEHIRYTSNSLAMRTVVNIEHSLQLIKFLERNQFKSPVFVTASSGIEYQGLQEHGVDSESILRAHQMVASNFFKPFYETK